MQKVKPLKRFGQNYLKDQNILNKIVEVINPKEDDLILEIGPGQGALTKLLLDKVSSIKAVEIDKRVADELREKFTNLELITDGFMNLNLNEIAGNKKLRVVGNIPYNITSPIIFKLIKNHNIINDTVLMVQHEVAKRMNGRKGTKDYGILSLILEHFTRVEYCFKVSPKVFYPRPKVDSAVVHIVFRELNTPENVNKMLIKIIKASFGNRRKTLKNSLSNSIFKDLSFANCGIDLTLRAEQLDLADFIKLAEFALENQKN
ncbi:MAG TPA: 16S rRNA (adenine(1518)-N(6)/adenine(1519)-N(6))-dimethyltransferase RsmA [Ignavibacteriaceae bacterium]|nr:16S rRNA (adenine(1518)-N(6)/adenine(1519)-N(6))-dimethyltransferase RsmA [Ignavibacteriaceae bacterium]